MNKTVLGLVATLLLVMGCSSQPFEVKGLRIGMPYGEAKEQFDKLFHDYVPTAAQQYKDPSKYAVRDVDGAYFLGIFPELYPSELGFNTFAAVVSGPSGKVTGISFGSDEIQYLWGGSNLNLKTFGENFASTYGLTKEVVTVFGEDAWQMFDSAKTVRILIKGDQGKIGKFQISIVGLDPGKMTK